MKSIFITLILLFSTLLQASAVIGTVETVTGSVKVKSEGSIKKSKIKIGQEIKEGDLVTTSRKGKTVIKLVDGSSIVLDISSSVHFAANNSIEQKGGKVFYNITSRNAKNSLKVKTPFAIIGIKGTTFVINSSEDKKSVALKEGKIGVASATPQTFNLYRKEILAKYNEFVNAQMDGFDKFRGIEKPKPEVTREFDLKAGNVISFEGNTVKESAWGANDDAEFGNFESMAGSALAKVVPPKLSDTIKDADDEFGEPVRSNIKDSDHLDEIEKSMDF